MMINHIMLMRFNRSYFAENPEKNTSVTKDGTNPCTQVTVKIKSITLFKLILT